MKWQAVDLILVKEICVVAKSHVFTQNNYQMLYGTQRKKGGPQIDEVMLGPQDCLSQGT